jgi:hypothetical protein
MRTHDLGRDGQDDSRPSCLLRVMSPEGRTLGLAFPERVSPRGARLTASGPQPFGAALLVARDGPAPPAAGAVPLRVVWSEELPDGGFLLLGVFARRLTAGELASLSGGESPPGDGLAARALGWLVKSVTGKPSARPIGRAAAR